MTDEQLETRLREYKREDLIPPSERCPDSDTLIDYMEGNLDERTKRHVSVHLGFWALPAF